MVDEYLKERKRMGHARPFLYGFLTALALCGAALAVYFFFFSKEAEVRYYIRKEAMTEASMKDVDEGKYRGMMEALGDKYAAYYTKEEFLEMNQATHGYFIGIGVSFYTDEEAGEALVASVYKGSPAEEAGLIPGDVVTLIDGEPVAADSIQKLSEAFRLGNKKDVVLTVRRREDGSVEEMRIKAGPVDVPTVYYEMKEDGTGYILISNFRDTTPDIFEEAYTSLTEDGMERLIIDLRENGGGLVNSAVKTMRTFMPEGLLVYTENKAGKRKEYECDGENAITVPVAVLVNGGTASSAESMAGAIRDLDVGILVGETTYGKGIVQSIRELRDDSAIRYTAENYYTPDGFNLNGTGLTPDIEVSLGEDGVPDTGETDAQYLAALEALK